MAEILSTKRPRPIDKDVQMQFAAALCLILEQRGFTQREIDRLTLSAADTPVDMLARDLTLYVNEDDRLRTLIEDARAWLDQGRWRAQSFARGRL
ncbi:MAG TPA: hypothetical protein VG328_16185 [Stellaceae bacterium]|jgi:hypothetical protein|nr:hypothetical protein [Stellaceae bacterium]